MINPSKLLPSNRSTSTASPEGVKITVKNVKVKSLQKGIVRDLITIDSYFKNRLKFTKKKVRIKRRDRLQQEFKTRENFLESTKKLIKGPARLVNKLIPNTVKNYWSTIKNFFLKIFLGFIAVRFFELLPKLSGFLKLLAGVGKFLIDFGGLLLGGLVSFITFGDRLVSGLRDQVGNIFGSKGVQLFDRLTNVLATVINLTTIAAGIAIFQAFRFRSLQDRLLDINRRRGGGGGLIGGSGSKVPKGPKGPFGTTGAVARVFEGLFLAADILALVALGKALVVTALTPIPGDEIIAGGLFARTGIRVIRKLNQFRKVLGFTNPLRDVDDAGNAINFFKRRKIRKTTVLEKKVPVTGLDPRVTFGEGSKETIRADLVKKRFEKLINLRKERSNLVGTGKRGTVVIKRGRIGKDFKTINVDTAPIEQVPTSIVKKNAERDLRKFLKIFRKSEKERPVVETVLKNLRGGYQQELNRALQVGNTKRVKELKKILEKYDDALEIITNDPATVIKKRAEEGAEAAKEVGKTVMEQQLMLDVFKKDKISPGPRPGEAAETLKLLKRFGIQLDMFEDIPIKKFFGGLVLGTPGIDKVPAMLTSGEFVLDLDSTNYLEGTMPGFLSALNKAKPKDIAGVLRRYAFYDDPEPKERIVYVPIKQPSKSAPPQESRGGGVIVKNKNGGGKSSAASEILYRG